MAANVSKEKVRGKKPVAASVKTTGGDKPKYEKADYRQRLREIKKTLATQQSKPKTKTTKVEINTEEFNYNKQNPMKVDGWLVWKGASDILVVMPENKKQNERYYKFPFEDGYLFLTEKPNMRYAYFHDRKFQDFLDRYNINRVMHKDPNGEYQGRNDTSLNTVSVFSFVTDGDWEEGDKSMLRMDEQPILSMNKANVFVKVKNATFVLVEQVAYRTDDANIEPFVLRMLVSDYDIYSLEHEIAEAVAYLDAANESDSNTEEEVAPAAE